MAKSKTAEDKKPLAKTVSRKKELTRAERLQSLMNEVNASFTGKVSLQAGQDFTNVFLLRRPTGITSLDLAIGGGFPAGGMSQIIGKEGVGKDYLVNRTMAQLQGTYGADSAILLAMTELSYDKEYGRKCGVRVALHPHEIAAMEAARRRPLTADERAYWTDQVGEVHQLMAANAEILLEETAKCIEANVYQLVVINSFGALLTKAEEEAKEGIVKKHYGGAAVALTNFMKRVHAALNLPDANGRPNTTTILGINQYRENLGPDAQWNPIRIAGGAALKHGKLIDVLLEQRARIKVDKPKPIIFGKEIHWQITKGKAGCHDGPKGMYPFYFGEYGYPFGADFYQDLIMCGALQGVIEQSGAWFAFQDDTFNLRGQGKENFAHAIASEPGAYEHIRGKVLDAAKIYYVTSEQGLYGY